MAAMRFCYGALTVTVLMLCRYAFAAEGGAEGGSVALLGVAVASSGAGFFLAALVTPWGTRRTGVAGWIVICSAVAAFLPVLGLPFEPEPVFVAAFLLGLVTQGAKISTDTVVQEVVADGFRGRVFSIYDVVFNVAFVGAAAVAAAMLPPDGRSPTLLLTIAAVYAMTAIGYGMAVHRRPPAPRPGPPALNH